MKPALPRPISGTAGHRIPRGTPSLQAIDLHPLDWEEVVRQTGRPMPYMVEVLEAASIEYRRALEIDHANGGMNKVSTVDAAGAGDVPCAVRLVVARSGRSG